MAAKKSKAKIPSHSVSKSPAISKEPDTTLSVLTHIFGILSWFIGALIILLVTKDEKVKQHARRALNWQLSLIIYYLISFMLIFVLVGILLIFVLAILNLIFCIIAAVKASNKELYDYPMTIRFIKD